MANVTTNNPIVIDTPGTAVNLPNVRTVKAIVWCGTQNSNSDIADADDLILKHHVYNGEDTGSIIFEKRARSTTDGITMTFAEPMVFPQGIRVSAMDGGNLYIFQ